MIEMLISLSIFAVITAFVTANFRAGRQSDELRQSTQLLATAVRRAQTMAISGQTVPYCQGGTNDRKVCAGGTDAECGGGTCVRDVPRGYGIRLTTVAATAAKVILYADVNGSRAYDAGEEIRVDSVTPGPFVTVTNLDPVAANSLDVVFEPPKPKVWFNGSTATAVATVTLTHKTTGLTKVVSINQVTGQINAD
ncbi:MAG: hypothetical protein RL272_767 [Candidatus Parcubacteria bacterium]|jgi:Tfp pilus assembly protein FimT